MLTCYIGTVLPLGLEWHCLRLYLVPMEYRVEHHDAHEEWLALPADPGSWEAFGLLSERRVRRWALVLEAKGIPYRIEQGGMAWRLLVPIPERARAQQELHLFEEENRNWPPPSPPAKLLADNILSTLSVLLLLASFHNLTSLGISPFGQAIDWQLSGAADAGLIREGQWWRLITPLTLHADVGHLISNLAIGGFFIVLLCRELGSGLAWSLLLASGILGNLINAWLQAPGHRSVGASTLVFGAVGILAALSLVRYRHHLRKRWAVPVAGGLALLAILGTEGKQTDLGAHLFGFAAGVVLGLAAEFLLEHFGSPGRRLNVLLAVTALAVVVSAWCMAITA